jgi:hypothetical protein
MLQNGFLGLRFAKGSVYAGVFGNLEEAMTGM